MLAVNKVMFFEKNITCFSNIIDVNMKSKSLRGVLEKVRAAPHYPSR